jgi:predicted nucleic acid-binding protein
VILLDTTVLSYAVGATHQLREPCRRLLTAHAEGRVELTTTVEVVQEFAHDRARRRPRGDATALARRYRSAFALLTTEVAGLDLGLTLYERYERLGAFDAVLAAVALNRDAEALVSADRAFRDVEHLLRWIDPAAPAIDQLSGR